ncbi:MAG: CvpA family protein [Elusimicrobia bacterium]|nr:CvpA family protein [Elusimicrobiota bacterium]
MSLDLGVLALLGFFALSGYQSGAIRQLAHAAGLVVGWFASGPAAAFLTPLLAPRLGLPAAAVRVVLTGLLFGILGGFGAALVHALLAKLAGKRADGRVDDAIGLVLGVGKGGALVFVALSILLFFEKPLIRIYGPPPPSIATSETVALVRRHGLFQVVSLPAVAKLERLLAALRDPASARALLSKNPRLHALLADPRLRAVLQNESNARTLLSGDAAALQNNPQLSALLHDPRLSDPGR